VRSVPVRCVQVDNPAHLYLTGRGMVPTHNSTLGLDFMRSCSIKHRLASVIFSLEMSKSEIVMRLLSAEAKIKLSDMRSGRMNDDDWTRLARRMSEISEAPLYIDDSPNLTMMEIRAKARRLRQKADLKLVVVDYMQLMTSGKKFESRQVEVSEFSRNLKLLAKELEVPVVAISQLNRGPEQRTDKKPMLADLRESGCLTAATRILRADDGAEVTFGELMRTGERPLVWSLDEQLRMVARPMTNVFPSGRKEVFRLRLASGREVEATGNHPFLKLDRWTPLEQLKIGDRIAAPRRVPEPVGTQRMADSEVVLLADMIGDGSCVKNRPIHYPSVDDRDGHALATNDVYWDAVVEMTSLGERDVYDGTVSGTHNFVANGIAAHNSLEQDSDVVILLHRPDAFDRDDPRGGEADLILAKHRNGPTKTVTVAHQLHFSRFANMAR
jgi:replicative DNA helicase